MTISNAPSHVYSSPRLLNPTAIGVKLFLITLFILPLHSQVIYVMIPFYSGIRADIISMWKEFALLVVALLITAKFLVTHERMTVTFLDAMVALFISMLGIYVVASDNDMFISLYGFRVFVEPFAVLYIAKTIKTKFITIQAMMKYSLYLAALISLWAIFQAAFLGDRFLMELGYKHQFGRLQDPFYISTFQFQRAIGTLSSPNTLGIYLHFMIMMGVYLYDGIVKINRNVYFLSMTVMLVATIQSFSRSAWLALIISSISFVSMEKGFYKVFAGILRVIVVCVILLAVVYVVFPDTIWALLEHVSRTFSLRDPAAVGHISSLVESYAFMLKNPLGTGIGMNGPRAITRTVGINSENSFFILAFDVGIAGVVVYSLIVIAIIRSLLKIIKAAQNDENRKRFGMIMLAIYIGQIVAWNTLPYIVELEAVMILFFYIGIALNKNILHASNK